MNLIVIVCDTLRRDYLGCYGNTWVKTPCLDELSASGMTFDRCYVGSFPTVPQRHDLMCSNYVFHTTGWAPIQPGNTPVQMRLRKHGYICGFMTDHTQLMAPGMNYHQGFHALEWVRGHVSDPWISEPVQYEPPCELGKLRQPEAWLDRFYRNISVRRTEEDWPSPKTMAAAMRWLERNCAHERWLLYVDTFDVHEPWLPPKFYTEMYDPGYEGDEAIYPRYDFAGYLSDEELWHVKSLYAGTITMMDKWIGRLLEKVEDLGLADDTAIVFTSDHGWYHGEHGYIGKHTVLDRDKGWQFYDEVARVPLLIRAPNLPQGVRSNLVVQPVDVMPTMMEIMGLEPPPLAEASGGDSEGTHGRSALPAILGTGGPPREVAVTARDVKKAPGYRTWNAINDGRWCLQHAEQATEPELYDTVVDPAQLNNVFEGNLPVAEALHAKYLDYLAQIGCSDEQIENRRPLRP